MFEAVLTCPWQWVREQFRDIFLQLGFAEMPTNNFVESGFWSGPVFSSICLITHSLPASIFAPTFVRSCHLKCATPPCHETDTRYLCLTKADTTV